MAKTILFIDDNPVDRTLVSRLLSKANFNVILAENGTQAIGLAQKNKIDLILLDILLPQMSGIELAKVFQKTPQTQGLPIIFYTSIDTPKHLIDYASYGACDYIQKTMPPEDLIKAIKIALK